MGAVEHHRMTLTSPDGKPQPTGYHLVHSGYVDRIADGYVAINGGPSLLLQKLSKHNTQIVFKTHQEGMQMGHILLATPSEHGYRIIKPQTNSIIPATDIIIGYMDHIDPFPSHIDQIAIDPRNPHSSIRRSLAEQNVWLGKEGSFFIAFPDDQNLTTPLETV